MAEYEYSSGTVRPRAAVFARESSMEDLCASSLEAGISGSGGLCSAPYAAFPPPVRRWGSYRAPGPLSPRSGGNGGGGGGVARFFLDPVCEDEPRHFLDACLMCKMPLRNRDIYMYRGDVPFCSEECRQEQIEIDEASEKSWSLPMRASASRKEQQKQKAKASLQVRDARTVVAG